MGVCPHDNRNSIPYPLGHQNNRVPKFDSMKIVELTATESETVERAFYETKSYEMLLSVLSRQLNANANPETAKIIMHYAELCRAAQMKLKMAQDAVVAKYIDLDDSAFDRYLFDFSREEVRLFEKQTV